MAKKKKAGNTRHDKWWQLAKEQGYRSRASFKLIQINKKYDFLKGCKAVLDLCAAPGGWLQVCQKVMPANSLILGVDLLPIKPMRGVTTLEDDITSVTCHNWIKKQCQGWKLDAVIHDGAPNVGGATWLKDAYGQNELVLTSLKIAMQHLKAGGWFVTKVFRSQDYNALLWVLQKFFEKTEVTKPASSRNTSAEIFIVCQGYLAPKKVDPRLLDPEHVFKQIQTEKKSIDLFSTKVVRHREGYEDGVTILFKKASVTELVDADDPISVLGTYNELVFDEKAEIYNKHEQTSEEIRLLCKDLKVLGRSDFKALLKWRVKMREYKKELMKEQEKANADSDAEEEAPKPTPEDEDIKLSKELTELERKAKRKAKKEKAKRREKKRRLQRRMGLSMTNTADIVDTQEEQGLFSVNKIKSKDTLHTLHEAKDEDVELELSDDSEMDARGAPSSSSDDDDDNADLDPSQRRLADLEKSIGYLYDEYKVRKQIMSKQQKKNLREMGMSEEVEEDRSLEQLAQKIAGEEADEEDADAADTEQGLFEVPLETDAKEPGKQVANRWFARGIFEGIEGDDADIEEDPTLESGLSLGADAASDSDDAAEEEEGDGDEEMLPAEVEAKSKKGKGSKRKAAEADAPQEASAGVGGGKASKKAKTQTQAEGDQFEEVALDSDFSDDSDAQAEMMALGQLMIRKKDKTSLIDSGFNRFSWGREEDVPEWFLEDETKHMRAILPVTRDQVMAFKEQLKDINARPIKKIAEAKGRKKMKAVKRWEKLKNQANSIAEASGMSSSEKLKSIQKLYSKGNRLNKDKKPEIQYVVARKGGAKAASGPRKGNGKYKMVDKRMISDKRGQERAEKKQKKGKKGKAKRSKSGKKSRR